MPYFKMGRREAQVVAVRNRGGKGFLVCKSRLREPCRRGSWPLAERDLVGFAKYLPQRRQEVVPEGHTDSPMKQCLNIDNGLTCQEEWKSSVPDPGKGKESGWSGEVAGAGRGLGSR